MADEALLTGKRDAIVKEWVARTIASYPGEAARFLLEQKDVFRNPAGHIYAGALPALYDLLIGEWDPAEARGILEPVIRLRAVQDFTAAQAVGFIFLLKRIVREAAQPSGGALDDRIDQAALVAFDLFMKCREEAYEIKAREARRSRFVLERMNAAN